MMKSTSVPLFLWLSIMLNGFHTAQAKAVFAHFMVGNVPHWNEARWESEIVVAQTAKLDAFALNIAWGDDTVSTSVANAFAAANVKGFKLFFSFDYAGGPLGPWPQDKVLSYLTNYVNNGAYYHTSGGQPFVSTFEGPGNAADWRTIKAQTNAFFIPDYSSLGAGPALATGVADGLFNWNAWPWGPRYMDTFVDASYYQVLGKSKVLGQPGAAGKPYMMAVSPMFYTNLPGYDKNWLWNSAYLWFDRWQEVLFLQPDYVQIISWNDWGECHYIGPQDSTQWDGVFGPTKGNASYNYVDGFSHDGFRLILPYLIDLYKTNTTVFEYEQLLVWGSAPPCSGGSTPLNTASQLQEEFPADELNYQQQTYFMAILMNRANISLVDDTGTVQGRWVTSPKELGGLYVGVAPTLTSKKLTAQLTRSGSVIMSANITQPPACQNGIPNYNVWTGYATHRVQLGSTLLISDNTCVRGGSNNPDFDGFCKYTCGSGYCPPGTCYCDQIGASSTITVQPGKTPGPGYAKNDVNFAGLCAFGCGKGYCPDEYCTSVSRPVATPTISPFNPKVCTGALDSNFPALTGLCKWTCAYGYCPVYACQCSGEGVLTQPPPVIATSVTAKFLPTPGVMTYDDLCRFACERGHCPSDVCSSNVGCVSGSGSGGYAGLCDFSCGRGFCPPPCTCNAQGSAPKPTGYLPDVVGYALPGFANDFDALCNFTCNHGYCPTGVCGQEIFVTTTKPSGAFATITGLEPESASPTYAPGAMFEYDVPDDESLSLEIMILNAQAKSDIASFTCTDASPVSGVDGQALGCIAESTAWLLWAIYASGGEAKATTPDRWTKSRSEHDTHSFQYHSKWHPKPGGNCSTSHCRLAANAPEGVWVPAGNGTSSRGVYHELHFIRTGTVHGYAAYRGGYPGIDDSNNTETLPGGTLASRQYKLIRPSGDVRFYRDRSTNNYGNGFFVQRPDKYGRYNFVGSSVEKVVARSESSQMCMGFMGVGDERDLGYMILGPDATEDQAVAAAVSALENKCRQMAYYTGCTASDNDILESGVAEPEDPSNPSTELEDFDWELDCYIPGVPDSGDPSLDRLSPLEQRRKRSVSDYLELLSPEDLDGLDPDLDLEEDSKEVREHVYSLLEKRTASRKQKICKNPPGKTRNAVAATLSSSRYRNAAKLADELSKVIFGLDDRACGASLSTFKTISSIPAGMKVVAEHVMEIQSVKDFFQAMRDGIKAGGAALSTGVLPWEPFDLTNSAKATMFASWSSILTAVPSGGEYVSQTFYNALGTLENTDNNLVLDSLTNGLKATIWAGSKNIVAPSKWNTMTPVGRLGKLNRIRAVFDYLNSAEAQTSLSTTYSTIRVTCAFLTRALKGNNNITYDTQAAFTEFFRAHMDYMVANVRNWITSRLADEAAFWASGAAANAYGSAAAATNLGRVQALQSLNWLKITTNWLV